MAKLRAVTAISDKNGALIQIGVDFDDSVLTPEAKKRLLELGAIEKVVTVTEKVVTVTEKEKTDDDPKLTDLKK